MRFEGERKAGCCEQNCRSISLDLLRRLRSRVPQCAQPARISSIDIRFSSGKFLHKYPAQALYGTVVFVMVGQAVRTIQIQSNPQVMSLSLLSSPGPRPLFPKPPRPSPNQVQPSSKPKLVPKGLGLTLKSWGPPHHPPPRSTLTIPWA